MFAILNTMRRTSYRYNHIQQRWLSGIILEPLKARSILRVSGKDSNTFLQGLITNDMNNFERGTDSIYSLFLNSSGRVLSDSLIYKIQNNFLVECDAGLADYLIKHLNLFRVRKKVDILKTDLNVWVAFSQENDNGLLMLESKRDEHNEILVFKDSRLQSLGFRVIAGSASTKDELKKIFPQDTNFVNNITYEQHRYILGIGEGIKNLPQGKCFPLESNCDYLKGISFHKGCYIGQELTARTHHTGVIRKRLMPLIFEQSHNNDIICDSDIKSEDDQIVGKLRGWNSTAGLGLLRVEKVLTNKTLLVADKYRCTTYKPKWWP